MHAFQRSLFDIFVIVVLGPFDQRICKNMAMPDGVFLFGSTSFDLLEYNSAKADDFFQKGMRNIQHL